MGRFPKHKGRLFYWLQSSGSLCARSTRTFVLNFGANGQKSMFHTPDILKQYSITLPMSDR